MKRILLNSRLFLASTLVLGLLGGALAQAQEIEAIAKEPVYKAGVSYQVSNSYRVGVGDILSLSVYPQEEYTEKDILVRADGTATFPKIGEIYTYGKSIKELTQEITEKLNRSLRNHQVTLSVANTRPAIFYLTGAVNRQGPFQMSTNAHEQAYAVNNETSSRRLDQVLSNVLSNGGGVTLKADLANVQIRHRDSEEVRTVNMWNVLKNGSASDDPWLDPGDTVYVPELPENGIISDDEFKILVNSVLSPKTFPVRVVGEVQHPALVRLEGDSPYLSSAIVQAGGYTSFALKTAIAVRRFTDENHFTTLYVNPQKMDFMLRPNDVVYVGERKLAKASRFMAEASNVLSPFTSAASIAGNSAQTFGIGGWANFGK